MMLSLRVQNRILSRSVALTCRCRVAVVPPSERLNSALTTIKIPSRSRINSRSTYNRSRWLSSVSEAVAAESATSAVVSTPPIAVRTALVATTTAMFTPACPVVGFVNLGLRYVIWDSQTRYAILGATTVLGGVAALVNFAAFDLLPVAYSYGQLFLPFAVVNGGFAGTAYLALDLAFGTATIARMPWTGAIMGTVVGFLGPVSGLYDYAFQWFYDIPEADGWFTYLLNNGFMLPISMATGAAVGVMMHPLLYYPVVGIPGVHWAKFSAPFLAFATFLVGNLYAGDYFNDDLFPRETYLSTEEKRGFLLIPRFHPKRLQEEDWGSQLGYQPPGTGIRARDSIREKIEKAKHGDIGEDMVFDSRRKAWLHYVTHGAFGSNIALESVPTEGEINQQGWQFLSNDGAVAFLLLEDKELHHTRSKNYTAVTELREGLERLAAQMQPVSRIRVYKRERDDAKRAIKRLELASHGIALLFTRQQQQESSGKTQSKPRAEDLERLERNIRKLVPGILLYKSEEVKESEGCSVESQLKAFGWKGSKNNELIHQWRRGLHQVLSEEREQENTRQLRWAVTGLGLILLYGLLGRQ